MNLNTASIKSLLHAKVLETEGVTAANFASEGTVFTPPDDAGATPPDGRTAPTQGSTRPDRQTGQGFAETNQTT